MSKKGGQGPSHPPPLYAYGLYNAHFWDMLHKIKMQICMINILHTQLKIIFIHARINNSIILMTYLSTL